MIKRIDGELTEDQIISIEQDHNVCIDRDTLQYNQDNIDAVYGWDILPENWILEVKGEFLEEGADR